MKTDAQKIKEVCEKLDRPDPLLVELDKVFKKVLDDVLASPLFMKKLGQEVVKKKLLQRLGEK